MRRALLGGVLLLFLAGCVTLPSDGGEDEATITAPAVMAPTGEERVTVSPEAEEVILRVRGLPEPTAGTSDLEVEARFLGLDESPRAARLSRTEEGAEVRLSPEGLRSGGSYDLEIRLRSPREESGWSDPVTVEVEASDVRATLFLVDPIGSFPLSPEEQDEPLGTVDRTPRFTASYEGPVPRSLELRLLNAQGQQVVFSELDPLSGGRSYQTSQTLAFAPHLIEVEILFAGGILAQEPVRGRFEVRELEAPPATAHGEGLSPVVRPALRWRHQVGADSYEVAFQQLGAGEIGALEQLLSQASTETVQDDQLLLEEDTLTPGGSFGWRVRPIVEERAGPWSEGYMFTYQPLLPEFSEVVAPGEEPEFLLGNESGSADEIPERQVSLTIPFDMARLEVTNLLAAALFNSGLDHGRFRLEELLLRRSGDGAPLLYLDSLEYGEQLGLALGEDNRIAAVVGRASHPAVGVTWGGAVALAQELSFLEGRPVWTPGGAAPPIADGPSQERELWMYRLPTEAEWEYAASEGEERSFPWGEGTPRGRANYYRSGDAFEDPNPPYTGAGGPTTPVGLFGESSPFGQRDLIGNVWEWCLDWYDPKAYAAAPGTLSPVLNPAGPREAVSDEFGVENRSLRGLAWNSRVEDLRLTNRGKYPPNLASWSIGVRLVLADAAPEAE